MHDMIVATPRDFGLHVTTWDTLLGRPCNAPRTFLGAHATRRGTDDSPQGRCDSPSADPVPSNVIAQTRVRSAGVWETTA